MTKKRKGKSVRLDRDMKDEIKRRVLYEYGVQRDAIGDEMAQYAMIAMCVAVYDVLGIKGEVLEGVLDKFMLQFDCLVAGTVELGDLVTILREEAELDIREV